VGGLTPEQKVILRGTPGLDVPKTRVLDIARLYSDRFSKYISAEEAPLDAGTGTAVLAKIDPVLHFFSLVGRNIANPAQVLDDIVDANGRLITHEAGFGLSALVDTGQVAGNANFTVAAVADGLTYELWYYLYSYRCDATVASRTTIAPTMQMLPSAQFATGVANSLSSFVTTSTLALTASQDGHISLTPGGTENKNLNGTITAVTGKLQLPARTISLPSIAITAATNGVAGDFHRAALIGREIT
jgi:hypothetical protein